MCVQYRQHAVFYVPWKRCIQQTPSFHLNSAAMEKEKLILNGAYIITNRTSFWIYGKRTANLNHVVQPIEQLLIWIIHLEEKKNTVQFRYKFLPTNMLIFHSKTLLKNHADTVMFFEVYQKLLINFSYT